LCPCLVQPYWLHYIRISWPATFRGQSGQRERQKDSTRNLETRVWRQGAGANFVRQSITGRDWARESEGPVVTGKRVMIVEPRALMQNERVRGRKSRLSSDNYSRTEQAVWMRERAKAWERLKTAAAPSFN